MSLDSLLSGREAASKAVQSIIKPLLPSVSDYSKDCFLGGAMKISPVGLSAGERSVLTAAFSELSNLILARKCVGLNTGIFKRLRGGCGLTSLGIASPSLCRKVQPLYLDAFGKYRAYVYGGKKLGDILQPCWLMAKLAHFSRRGFFSEELRDFIAPPKPEIYFQLTRLAELFEGFLNHRYPRNVPADLRHIPCFGNLSRGMGGASGDFYLDGMIWLVNTSADIGKLTSFNRKAAALAVMAEASKYLPDEGDPCDGWKGIGIYFARFSTLLILKREFFLSGNRAEFYRAQEFFLRRYASVRIVFEKYPEEDDF